MHLLGLFIYINIVYHVYTKIHILNIQNIVFDPNSSETYVIVVIVVRSY